MMYDRVGVVPYEEVVRCVAEAARAGDRGAQLVLQLLAASRESILPRLAARRHLVAAGLVPPGPRDRGRS